MVDFGDNWARIPKANASVTLAWLESVEQLQWKGMREGGRSFSSQHNPCGSSRSLRAQSYGLSVALRANKDWPAPTSDLDTCFAVQGHPELHLYRYVNIILFSP